MTSAAEATMSKTASRLIEVATWGRFGSHDPLGTIRVRIDPHTFSVPHATAESIARRLRLAVASGPRDEGTAIERGAPVSHHYAVTLGRPCRGGGYTPEAEVWFAVPVVGEVLDAETRCAYCDADVPDDRDRTPPRADDDDAWEALARLHADDCEWVRTRAHRLEGRP
jgi:hypothetical protein